MRRAVILLLAMSCAALASPRPGQAEPPASKRGKGTARACLQPLGKYDRALLESARKGIAYVYGFEVEVLTARPMPERAYYKPRKRWRADIILDVLREDVPDQCDLLVGFTRQDVSTSAHGHKDWGVLGLAEVGGEVGVVSSFRTRKKLKPPHTQARRVVKVVNHEVGHILGLPHLQGAEHPAGGGCLMNDAEGTVLTTDRENGLLCPRTIRWIERNLGHELPRHDTFDWSMVE